MTDAILNMKATEFTVAGKTVDEIAQDKIDDISIGGTNLLPGTKTFSKGIDNGTIDSSAAYLGFTALMYDASVSSRNVSVAAWTGLELEPDTDYTLSFYVKGNGEFITFLYNYTVQSGYDMAGTTTNFHSGSISYSGVTSDWQRYWVVYHTLHELEGTKNTQIQCLAGSKIWICGVKLEKGNRPTDWSPSPLDAEEYTNSAINNQSQEFIFNKLTNNGMLQGLFMQNGQLYINTTYLRGDTLDLNLLRLLGTNCGLIQGKGKVLSGQQTQGIVMFGNGLDNGAANFPYLIVTNAGIRGQTDSGDFNFVGHDFEIDGRLKVRKSGGGSGSIHSDGDIDAVGNIVGYDFYALRQNSAGSQSAIPAVRYQPDNDQLFVFGETYTRSNLTGRAIYIGVPAEQTSTASISLYANYIVGTVQYSVSSDRRLKRDIKPLDEAYIKALDAITPVQYRYKDDPVDGPIHMGYIAQDVQAAMDAAGIDASLVGEAKNQDGEQYLSLAYSEMIAMLHAKINSLEAEIKQIKEKIA